MNTVVENISDARNQVIITIEGADRVLAFADVGVTMDTPENDILTNVQEALAELGAPNIRDTYGNFSYAVRKAVNSSTIYVFPKPTAGSELPEQSNTTRLGIYNMLLHGCSHMYSKGKLQEDKFKAVAKVYAELAVHDPIFLAHLTAWACGKSESKDMKVISLFFNALNDANGTPFVEGSDLKKPNYRQVSYALLQELDPHLALRVLELAHKKFGVAKLLNEASHFPTGLRTAFAKYLKYREAYLPMLRGARRNGLGSKIKDIYRLTHVSPSAEAASVLGWKQKDGSNKNVMAEKMPEFESMTSAEIASALKETKISTPVAISVIPKEKINLQVATALVGNCTGNQAVILHNFFSKNGFLDNAKINALFKNVVKKATTAVDRIETLTRNASEKDKDDLSQIRSDIRKKTANTSAFGKIFMHIDISSSMNTAIQYAKDNASIFAECVDKPSENFRWGTFNGGGRELPIPSRFDKAGFAQALYGVTAGGSTDCTALYANARKWGADIDVYITDQGHAHGGTTAYKLINEFHQKNPGVAKPRCAVIVDFSVGNESNPLGPDLVKAGIPVAYIKPNALKESALVAQLVATSIKGEVAIIEEILATPLPSLPIWWNDIGAKNEGKKAVTA